MQRCLKTYSPTSGSTIAAVSSVTGLVIASLFLTIGFWRTLFLLLFVCGGFFIGYKIDKKEDLAEWLDRLLPPGYHK